MPPCPRAARQARQYRPSILYLLHKYDAKPRQSRLIRGPRVR
ncbi:Uncharacterized protein ChrSV_0995 [Chromobacterium vaccinii]|nr:Uncharacterized protein ChrSW_0995 [Chromobacterium vaccinii]QND88454.1 Uncharacterized protein ChrSV_0995 [Chromobacterium vaccinii]